MKRNLLIRLLVLSACVLRVGTMQHANAQPYYFRHYQVENGLSNSTVFCSIQDNDGFMWFGTKEGLNRFDGYHFKLFTTDDTERPFSPDLIFSLFTDKKGTLWIGSQKGLYWFDARNERLVRFSGTTSDITDVAAIQEDDAGRLWFISRQNVCYYSFTTQRLQQFPAASFFYATTLCKGRDGTMWFATDRGFLEKFDTATSRFKAYNMFAQSPRPASYWVQTIKPAPGGDIYVGTTSQGLKLFNPADETYRDVLTYNPDKTTIFVRDILDNGNNEYWFATESGIFILQTNTGKFINLKKKFLDPYSLSDNAVYVLCKDREGSIWAGTYFGGLNYYPKQYATFKKYFPDNTGSSISGSAVREICEDDYGNLWIGTEDAGLNKLNKATGAITHFEPTGDSSSISYTNIHGLLVNGNDLWIGTFEHGLDVMDIKTGKVKKHYTAGPGKNDLNSNFTLCLVKSSAGQIYIGTSNGFYQFNEATSNFQQPAGIPIHLFVSCITEDYNHVLWVGTHGNGAYWYNPATKETGHVHNIPGKKNSLTNNDINALDEDSRHNLWFSTEGGGVCRLGADRKTITAFTTKNGLPGNFIFKTLEDNQKNLWITTSKGLVQLNPDFNTVNIYTRANGLLNDQFNYHSGYKDQQGNLYFGSVKGMISFNPGDFARSHFSPPVYITGFQVHNQELAIDKDSSFLKQSVVFTERITLPYDRSSFSIDFAALSFVSPEMTQYSYQMEGLDREWTILKTNRKVYFTNLSPGTYTFKLKVAANGQSARNAKELVIKITPPFWATIYAYFLYVAIFTGLCYYLFRTYHNRLENKKEKEIYEAKINFFTIVAHEIRTPLTLIKGPVENLHEKIDELPEIKEDVVTLERNTSRLVALITQILDFRQTEKKGFSIELNQVNITAVLEEEWLNFIPLAKKKNLLYKTDLPRDPVFAMADEEALHKIFSNLCGNAVKYAAGMVNIRLLPVTKETDFLTLEISNDGYLIPSGMNEKIFEPFYRLKETIKQKGTGIGLALARSLAELHDGKLWLKDTKDGLNTFVLELPLRPQENENIKQKRKKILTNTK